MFVTLHQQTNKNTNKPFYFMKTNTYKTIRNGQAVMMNTWKIERASERAMVHDMGVMDFYKEYVTDEDRVFASTREIFLSNDPAAYEADNRKYANPLVLVNGEIVRLEGNGKLYRVVDMRPRGWEYISDPIHFELVK